MSEFTNMPAGTTVPVTGKYKCEFCGEGGFADTISQRFRQTQKISFAELEKLAKKEGASTLTFERGTAFPKCANCGNGALWTLVERLEEDD